MTLWLIKSEPDVYSFAQLTEDGKTAWTGVRNYTARNSLRAMKVGDLALYYHSNIGKAVVGIAKVVREAYKDESDAEALEGDWSAVDVAPVRPLACPVTLDDMREHPTLKSMMLFKQGRLSVIPVTQAEYDAILVLGARQAPAAPPPKVKRAKPKRVAKKKTAKKSPPKKKTAAKKAR